MVNPRRVQITIALTLSVVAAITAVATAYAFWMSTRDTTGPDLSGTWRGRPGWGTVILEPRDGGGFEGTYSDTYGRDVGRIELSWDARRGKFKGLWSEGAYRFGELTVEPRPDGTFRGEYSADPGCEHDPGRPASEEFRWVKPGATSEFSATRF